VYKFNGDSCCSKNAQLTSRVSVPYALDLAFSPCGRLLVVVSTNLAGGTTNLITVFEVDKHCVLHKIQTITSIPNPTGVAFAPNGNCVAITAGTPPDKAPAPAFGVVYLFKATKKCGLQGPLFDPINTGGQFPILPTYSPHGDILALIDQSSGTFSLFKADKGSCTLSEPNTYPVIASNLQGIAWSPSDTCLAVTTYNPGHVSIYGVNKQNATATLVQPPVPTGFATSGVIYSKNGGCLFVANQLTGILAFDGSKNDCTISEQPISVIKGISPLYFDLKDTCLVVTDQLHGTVNPYRLDCRLKHQNNTPPDVLALADQNSSKKTCIFAPIASPKKAKKKRKH
jgi:DNA-binding beta-propeller fold protein YncE